MHDPSASHASLFVSKAFVSSECDAWEIKNCWELMCRLNSRNGTFNVLGNSIVVNQRSCVPIMENTCEVKVTEFKLLVQQKLLEKL